MIWKVIKMMKRIWIQIIRKFKNALVYNCSFSLLNFVLQFILTTVHCILATRYFYTSDLEIFI